MKGMPMDFKELAKFMFPPGTLDYFDFEDIQVEEGTAPFSEVYTVYLVEKNILPELSPDKKDRELRFKGYQKTTLADFPLRGRKVFLSIKRRKWMIKGEPKVFMRELVIDSQGVQLSKDFAFFFETDH